MLYFSNIKLSGKEAVTADHSNWGLGSGKRAQTAAGANFTYTATATELVALALDCTATAGAAVQPQTEPWRSSIVSQDRMYANNKYDVNPHMSESA